jgi:hypothetical protein
MCIVFELSPLLSSSLTNLPPNINTQFFCCTKASSISFSRPGATAGKLPLTLPKQPLQRRTQLIIQRVKILHTKAGKRLHMQDQYLGTPFSRCSQELSTILSDTNATAQRYWMSNKLATMSKLHLRPKRRTVNTTVALDELLICICKIQEISYVQII